MLTLTPPLYSHNAGTYLLRNNVNHPKAPGNRTALKQSRCPARDVLTKSGLSIDPGGLQGLAFTCVHDIYYHSHCSLFSFTEYVQFRRTARRVNVKLGNAKNTYIYAAKSRSTSKCIIAGLIPIILHHERLTMKHICSDCDVNRRVPAVHRQQILPQLSFFGVLLYPRFCCFQELFLIFLVFPGNALFNCVVRLGVRQQPARKRQNRIDLAARLPLIRPEQSKAHTALIIVCHVGMVDLGLERERRRFERVFLR